MNTNNNLNFSLCGFDVAIDNQKVLLGSHLINDCLDNCAPSGTLSRIDSAQINFPVEEIPLFTEKLQLFLCGDDLNDLYFTIADDEIKISFYRNLHNLPMIKISSKKAQVLYTDLSRILLSELGIDFCVIFNFEATQFLIDNLNRVFKNLKPLIIIPR